MNGRDVADSKHSGKTLEDVNQMETCSHLCFKLDVTVLSAVIYDSRYYHA